jgi:hypothetical protein
MVQDTFSLHDRSYKNRRSESRRRPKQSDFNHRLIISSMPEYVYKKGTALASVMVRNCFAALVNRGIAQFP